MSDDDLHIEITPQGHYPGRPAGGATLLTGEGQIIDFTPRGGGAFTAQVRGLPVTAEGASFEAAYEAIKAALRAYQEGDGHEK